LALSWSNFDLCSTGVVTPDRFLFEDFIAYLDCCWIKVCLGNTAEELDTMAGYATVVAEDLGVVPCLERLIGTFTNSVVPILMSLF